VIPLLLLLPRPEVSLELVASQRSLWRDQERLPVAGNCITYDEPVSKMTSNEVGGVPTAMLPKYLWGVVNRHCRSINVETYVESNCTSVNLQGIDIVRNMRLTRQWHLHIHATSALLRGALRAEAVLGVGRQSISLQPFPDVLRARVASAHEIDSLTGRRDRCRMWSCSRICTCQTER
jgi:hypothetical protein